MASTDIRIADKLMQYYSEESCALLIPFITKLLRQKDQQVYLNAFIEFHDITQRDILYATAIDIEKYLVTLSGRVRSGKCSQSKQSKSRKIVSAFFKFCEKLQLEESPLVPEDFVNAFELYTPEVFEDVYNAERIPSLPEIRTLIGYAKDNDTELLLVILLSVKSYLKTGEIARLKYTDVFYDKDDNCIAQIADRTGKKRDVLISSDTADYLQEYIDQTPLGSDCIFTEPSKTESWARLMQLHLKKACAICFEKRSYSFNDLRNAASVLAIAQGATPLAVSECMGYKSERHIQKLTSYCADIQFGGYANI